MMTRISKVLKRTPLWFVAVLCSVISFLFLVYSPFRAALFPESAVKKVYYVDNISEAHLKIIRAFNEINRGEIEVVPVNLPFYDFTTDDRKEILTRALRSRSDGVDIFAVDLIWIPRFAKWGFPMTGLFDSTTLAGVSKIALSACYREGSLVAFPLYLDEGVLYYRKDIVRAMPDGKAVEQQIRSGISWDEFISLGERFVTRGKNDARSVSPYYIFPGGEYEGMLCCFHEMLSDKESGEIFGEDSVNLCTGPAKRALQTMVDFIRRYRFSPFDVTRFDEYNSYLFASNHDAPFLRGWVGFHTQYGTHLKDSSTISKMERAPLPHFQGNRTSDVFGGWSLMVSRFSNHKREALRFIDFMFQKENQEILYEYGGYLPVNNAVYSDSAYMHDHPELAQARSLLRWGRHRPFLGNYTRMSEIMARHFHRALLGEISVDDALLTASRQINAEMAIVK